MPSNPNFLIFPEFIISGSSGNGESNIVITATDNVEHILKKGRRRRRHISIAGCELLRLEQEEFETFCDLVEDEYEPFLFRDIRRCRLKNEAIGTGDGVNKVFQLSRTRTLQGRSKTLTIKYPDHDYPARYFPAPEGMQGARCWPPPGQDGLVHVFVNGVEVSLDASTQQKLDDLRYKGLVTLQSAPANGATVTVSCFFYHLMRFNSKSPKTTPKGGGAFTIDAGIELIESLKEV